jgi:hypothetical protein
MRRDARILVTEEILPVLERTPSSASPPNTRLSGVHSVSFTICSFSSVVCCRRGPVRRPSESVEMLSRAEVST